MAGLVEIAPLEVHDLCAIFPEMSESDYAGLVESVREHGLQHPVVMFEGRILDGRHRYRACLECDVEPSIVEYRGQYGSPLAFVVAENLNRRHLSASQRATLAVEVKRRLNEQYRDRQIAGLKHGDDSPEPRFGNIAKTGSNARKEAAEAFGVAERYVSEAERIQESSPQVFAEVKAGEKTIPQAKRELGIGRPKPEPEPATADAAEPVADNPGDDDSEAPDEVIQAAREEHAEIAAKRDELTDEEWLATLPLTGKLKGHSLDKFRRDSIYYRRFEPVRRGLSAFHTRTKREAFRGASSQGFVSFRVGQLLSVEHPKGWHVCPPERDGGCDGTGTVGMIGQCPMCHGRGYLAR